MSYEEILKGCHLEVVCAVKHAMDKCKKNVGVAAATEVETRVQDRLATASEEFNVLKLELANQNALAVQRGTKIALLQARLAQGRAVPTAQSPITASSLEPEVTEEVANEATNPLSPTAAEPVAGVPSTSEQVGPTVDDLAVVATAAADAAVPRVREATDAAAMKTTRVKVWSPLAPLSSNPAPAKAKTAATVQPPQPHQASTAALEPSSTILATKAGRFKVLKVPNVRPAAVAQSSRATSSSSSSSSSSSNKRKINKSYVLKVQPAAAAQSSRATSSSSKSKKGKQNTSSSTAGKRPKKKKRIVSSSSEEEPPKKRRVQRKGAKKTRFEGDASDDDDYVQESDDDDDVSDDSGNDFF